MPAANPGDWRGHRSSGQGSSVPTLETERTILRVYRKSDFRPWHSIMGQPEVSRHFGGDGMSEEDCWRRMAASVGMWDLIGMGGWAVVRKEDQKLVGTVSLFNAWRAMEPVFGEEPEMGWIFSGEVHGKGYAGEACRAALAWADANLQPTPIWAIIAPENDPSIRLADRLGFTRVGDSVYKGEPTLVLRREAIGG